MVVLLANSKPTPNLTGIIAPLKVSHKTNLID